MFPEMDLSKCMTDAGKKPPSKKAKVSKGKEKAVSSTEEEKDNVEAKLSHVLQQLEGVITSFLCYLTLKKS